MDEIAVIGAGGHAKVVVSTLQAAGYEVSAVYDDNPAKWGTTVLEIPVKGSLEDFLHAGVRRAVIAVGSNLLRKRIAQRLHEVEWVSVVHPQACVHSSVKMGAGTLVFAGAIIQPDAVVGSHVIINTGSTVDHDSVVGDFAHVAPGVHLAGSVQIGTGTLMGVGSSATPGCRVGSWTVVGAGAVVVRDLPDSVTAVGIPAVPLSVSTAPAEAGAE